MQRLEKYSLKTFKYAEKTPLPKMCSLGLKLLRDPKRRGTPNEDFPLKLSRSLVCEKKRERVVALKASKVLRALGKHIKHQPGFSVIKKSTFFVILYHCRGSKIVMTLTTSNKATNKSLVYL